jgi:hypothetical protein
MKKSKLLLGLLVFSTLSYAQQCDCSNLEAELKNIKNQVAELNKQVNTQLNYYKETLNLLKPITTVSADGMEISITKVSGSRKDKTVTVTFMYKNTQQTVRKDFQCTGATFITAQGEQYKTYEIVVGANKSIRAENIHPDIPAKATITFKTNETDFPIIRILSLSINTSNLNTKEAAFENLPIVWE